MSKSDPIHRFWVARSFGGHYPMHYKEQIPGMDIGEDLVKEVGFAFRHVEGSFWAGVPEC